MYMLGMNHIFKSFWRKDGRQDALYSINKCIAEHKQLSGYK